MNLGTLGDSGLRMFVVFDTNVWLSELALNSASGSAVRFFMRHHKATVVMPDVVKLELERHLTGSLTEWVEEIRANHSRLLAIFGHLKEVVLPTADQISQKVSEIVSALDVPLRHMPLSLDAARSAFLRTVDKIPPADKSQEFKDGVILANCLELLKEADVYLVTQDKAFYAGRDYSAGPAKNLLMEAGVCANRFYLIRDLAHLLQDIRRDVKIDETGLVKAFLPDRFESVNRVLTKAGFALMEPPTVRMSLFATEAATRVYIEFALEYECSDARGLDRPDARLELRGVGSYDTASEHFADLQSSGEKLEYIDEQGDQKLTNTVIAVGAAHLGHRTVHHIVRVPI